MTHLDSIGLLRQSRRHCFKVVTKIRAVMCYSAKREKQK